MQEICQEEVNQYKRSHLILAVPFRDLTTVRIPAPPFFLSQDPENTNLPLISCTQIYLIMTNHDQYVGNKQEEIGLKVLSGPFWER